MSVEGRRIELGGVVQGVGLRPWIYRLAHEAGLSGRVRNDSCGVTIDVFGSGAALDGFVTRLAGAPPASAAIRRLAWTPIGGEPSRGFDILASALRPDGALSIPPDGSTCPDCLAELLDPRDRRYRYPFTTCTQCGPRYTITRAVPWDRAATAMAPFAMCADCAREYASPDDRRFHAEANACPACGPRLRLLDAKGAELVSVDPLRDAAAALCAGLIVAVKGIGGYHLACDVSAPAVGELRAFKRRDEKPFAVMVRDLAAAARLGELGRAERRLLASCAAPIVVVRRRADAALPDAVAPGLPSIGLFLPYSPLHHLLLADCDRPLVMTSANRDGDPIVHRDAVAVRRLASVADRFLVHDREIEAPCEDSVVRVVDDAPVLLRRARGWAPRAVPIRPVARPVLACGGDVKNACCIAVGDRAYLGPHVGDLGGLEAFEAFEATIDRLEQWLGVRPTIVAHDLHLGHRATTYALSRRNVVTIAVQHHHAHVASAMAEHGLDGPVFGVAYDGTGWGPDGTAWGGELLLADFAGYERLASFRPLSLAGGDTAIREVWRVALAALDDAFGDASPLDRFPLFAGVPAGSVAVVRQMIARELNVPRARGVGRWFDAIGALVLGRRTAAYEGQVATALELAAGDTTARPYPYLIDDRITPWEVDLRPLVMAIAADAGRVSVATIAAGFHETLVRATEGCVRAAAERMGRRPVVLTGGCFQNARLARDVVAALSPDFPVYLQREVPPGDGGLALGQAMVADAVARGAVPSWRDV